VGALSARAFWRDPVWISAVALYALNRWLLKPHLPWEFLHFHFNDCLLIPAALPPVLGLQRLLGLRVARGAPEPWEVLFHLSLWSVLFEGIGPRFLPVSGDWQDVLCYAAGAVVASLLWFGQRREGFDRLAPFYGFLEGLACGGSLQRTRVAQLKELKECREILVAGEGTGRFLAKALAACPRARFTCVDASHGMLERLGRKLEKLPADANRVRLLRARLPDLPADPVRYDAVVTPFFLDCFEGAALSRIVETLALRLRPGGLWLVADYALPASGWPRLRARFWLAVLYRFFRAAAGVQARRLEDPAPLLEKAGLRPMAERAFSRGLLRSRCWRREAALDRVPI
jgi:ubiquinone/menaquinone biosynthesis C-methylase UbiE